MNKEVVKKRNTIRSILLRLFLAALNHLLGMLNHISHNSLSYGHLYDNIVNRGICCGIAN